MTQGQLQIFQDEEQRDFRTMEIDGEPWFVFADVCRALGLSLRNGSFWHHANRLDQEDRRTAMIPRARQKPSPSEREGSLKMIVVNESGMYSLILRSDRPEAKRFKRWITSVVLPSIRKTGSFGAGAQPVPADWQPFHDRISAVWGAVPAGYFSVFKEMAELTGQLITQGVQVDHLTIPDISVGIAWSKHWVGQSFDGVYAPRLSYLHSYPPTFPQSKSNPQDAYCYPEEALGIFRRWLRNHYLRQGLPKYLSGKTAKGQIAHSTAKAILVAVGVEERNTPRLKPPSP